MPKLIFQKHNKQKNMQYIYNVQNIVQTQTIAQEFITSILQKQTDVLPFLVLLTAPVGAGKTVFVKTALQTLGVDTSHFTSPSYTFVNEYQNKDYMVYHIDLYRVGNTDDTHKKVHNDKKIAECMLDYLEIPEKIKTGILFIEWADRVDKKYFPFPYYDIYIDIISETQRNIKIVL